MQPAPPSQPAGIVVCTACGVPACQAYLDKNHRLVCRRCAGTYPRECIVISHIDPDSDEPCHTLLRFSGVPGKPVHLLRTNRPHAYRNAFVVGVAPAIGMTELLALLDAQFIALLEASHALKAGKSIMGVRIQLSASIADYTRCVGIGIMPDNTRCFVEPSGSIFVLDTLARLPDTSTSPNELALLVTPAGKPVRALLYEHGHEYPDLVVQLPPALAETSAVVRCPVSRRVRAKMQYELAAREMHDATLVPVELPVHPDGPALLIELPCALLLLFQQNGRATAFVVPTTDIRCKMVVTVPPAAPGGADATVVVAVNTYQHFVACSRPLASSDAVVSATAGFLRHEDDHLMLLPCILY